MSIREEMAELSKRLDLMDSEQDWGIVNGDSDRFEEFMAVYRSERLTVAQKGQMATLVLSSANERLEAIRDADLTEFSELLPQIASDAGWELDYWRGLEPEFFPLAAWLRTLS